MFLPDQSDSVVMDSLARENEARPVAGALRFLGGVGHRESRALEIVACVTLIPFFER